MGRWADLARLRLGFDRGGAAPPLHAALRWLDHAPQLVAEARRRLPQWADRIFLGNALDWESPHPFDFIRIELVYVPEERRREHVERLLGHVALGGRLIVCGYGGNEVIAPLRSWGYEPEFGRKWLSPRSGNRIQVVAIGVPA